MPTLAEDFETFVNALTPPDKIDLLGVLGKQNKEINTFDNSLLKNDSEYLYLLSRINGNHRLELIDFVDKISSITIVIGGLSGKAIRFDDEEEKLCIVANGHITVIPYP